ncbi:MAG TPA: polysaccharide biosynthesis/export family protein [Methylomirabilota bacterium]|nr:polysaccharide biosynthesis/export family protein [Methylomirabilota bacterium]
MKKFLALAFLCALSLAQAPTLQAQNQGQGQTTDYKIRAQDELRIDVFGEPELSNREVRVSAKGEISYPLLNLVHVAGKTPNEVEQIITAALDKDFIINPQVTVAIKKYQTRTANVTGSVNKQGQIELPAEGRSLTIIDAISAAGGLAKGAGGTVEFTRNGQTRSYKIDDLKKQTDPRTIIYVQEGDIINVRESIL